MDKMNSDKTKVLSAFPSSQVHTIFKVTYTARRLCSEGEKNEISIDDYLLNNTLLSFLSHSCASARVCVCVVVVENARDSVILVLVVVVVVLLFPSHVCYYDNYYSHHQNNDIILLITTIILLYS
jgi:hypothetical protein